MMNEDAFLSINLKPKTYNLLYASGFVVLNPTAETSN
jgi:hypothetical protein